MEFIVKPMDFIRAEALRVMASRSKQAIKGTVSIVPF